MSSVLMVQSLFVESTHKMKDNKFITSGYVSENQGLQDSCLAIALQQEMHTRLEKELNSGVVYLRLLDEPRTQRSYYEGKNEAAFVAESISMHHFTDDKGKINRRVFVLYPMSKGRRGELPREQVTRKIKESAENGKDLQIIDLQHLEKEGKVLEGLGALVFSPDGQYVYMGASERSNADVLAELCSPNNLNIAQANRFTFTAMFPNEKTHEPEVAYHTSLMGWCGKGICAWGFEFLKFESEEKQEAFFQHIEKTYEKTINLNEREIRAFAGNAFELAVSDENGGERRMLCIADSAMKALQGCNRKIIEEWYGHDNIIVFYGDVIQRRCGKSIRGLVSISVTHGKAIPAPGEQSAMACAKVEKFIG